MIRKTIIFIRTEKFKGELRAPDHVKLIFLGVKLLQGLIKSAGGFLPIILLKRVLAAEKNAIGD